MFLLAHQVFSIWFNFDRTHDDPEKYVLVLLFQKCLFFIISVIDFKRSGRYMIFFTHWGFIIITMAVTIDACLVSYRFSNQRSKIFAKRRSALQENCHWTLQISIFITAIAYPLAIFVTIAFWSFIHDWSHPFNLNLGNYLNLNVHLFQVESSHFSLVPI